MGLLLSSLKKPTGNWLPYKLVVSVYRSHTTSKKTQQNSISTKIPWQGSYEKTVE